MVDVASDIVVQVCIATLDKQSVRSLSVPDGTLLDQAIAKSGLLDEGFTMDPATFKAGIFGKLKPLDTLLRDGDRIEIYRPLIADPKESRRKRAEKKVATKAD